MHIRLHTGVKLRTIHRAAARPFLSHATKQWQKLCWSIQLKSSIFFKKLARCKLGVYSPHVFFVTGSNSAHLPLNLLLSITMQPLDHNAKKAHDAILYSARHLMTVFENAETGSLQEVDALAAANTLMNLIDEYSHLWLLPD